MHQTTLTCRDGQQSATQTQDVHVRCTSVMLAPAPAACCAPLHGEVASSCENMFCIGVQDDGIDATAVLRHGCASRSSANQTFF